MSDPYNFCVYAICLFSWEWFGPIVSNQGPIRVQWSRLSQKRGGDVEENVCFEKKCDRGVNIRLKASMFFQVTCKVNSSLTTCEHLCLKSMAGRVVIEVCNILFLSSRKDIIHNLALIIDVRLCSVRENTMQWAASPLGFWRRTFSISLLQCFQLLKINATT